MFTPRDPTTLSQSQLADEIQAIEAHIQDLTWLEVHLADIIVDIDVVIPVFKAAPVPGPLLFDLERVAGSCMRALHAIGRRQLTMRDAREQARFFLQGESEPTVCEHDWKDVGLNLAECRKCGEVIMHG